jgi:hypothetical protein
MFSGLHSYRNIFMPNTFIMTMKQATLATVLFLLIIGGCKTKDSLPDISKVKLNLSVQRFDQDFFSLDTLQLQQSLGALQQKYPDFLSIFLQRIVGISEPGQVPLYYRLYRPIYDSAQLIFKNFETQRAGIEEGLRYAKYYFPGYTPPVKIVPVIGPMNTREDLARMGNGDYTPNFIGPDFIGISLQFYLGNRFSLYNDEYFINNVAPLYRSRRFSKEYIIPEVMKLVADDIYPDKSNTQPLITQMIEKGKQWWLLDKFLPKTPDSLKTGYTEEQLEWCEKNEGLIWGYIIKNENLYAIDPATIQIYIGEGPFTQGFSEEASPGNIGQWIGWQIVKKFAESHKDLTPDQLTKTSAKQILDEAKYKPK